MTGLGVIGTVAAFANYRKKKAAFEALEEQYNALLDAVNVYNNTKLDQYIEHEEKIKHQNPLDYANGLSARTIFRFSTTIFGALRCQNSVVLTNTSDKTYYIGKVSAISYILGNEVLIYKINLQEQNGEYETQTVRVGRYIKPGEVMEIKLPHGFTKVIGKDGGNQWNEILDQFKTNAQRDGYSVDSNMSIVSDDPNIYCAEILVTWREENENEFKDMPFKRTKGVLRWMRGIFFPNDNNIVTVTEQ